MLQQLQNLASDTVEWSKTKLTYETGRVGGAKGQGSMREAHA